MQIFVADAGEGLTGVARWAVELMTALGPLGVTITIFLENAWPPIPSEIILPLAGFTAAQGSFTVLEAILFATVGSLVGAWMLYALGRVVGHDRLVAVAERLPLVRASDIDKTTDWFRRHGSKAVFLGRMIPIFRSLISIPAGIERMSFWMFTLLTLLGSLIWNSLFVIAGFLLGENWHVIGPYADWLQYAVIGVVVLVFGWWVVRRMRENRQQGGQESV